MPDYDAWDLVNDFTVAQAVCLWCGVDPDISFLIQKSKNPQIAAIEQMLVSEIRAGRLRADSTQNVLSSIGNYSESLVTREALKELAERKELKPKFLFPMAREPDPLENLPIVRTPQALVPMKEEILDFKLKKDSWTLTEALFTLHGCQPPGIETIDELGSHFPEACVLALNSIKSGTLCRETRITGERLYIDSPARWFAWALEKDLPIADTVRAKMVRGKSVDEKTDVPAQGTPGSGTQSSPSVSVEEKKDVPAQGASGSGTQSSQKRRRGGAKPGPYYSKLKKFMTLLHEKDLEKFENGTNAELRELVVKFFKRNDVLGYPSSRSGLDRAIARAKQEVIDSADRI